MKITEKKLRNIIQSVIRENTTCNENNALVMNVLDLLKKDPAYQEAKPPALDSEYDTGAITTESAGEYLSKGMRLTGNALTATGSALLVAGLISYIALKTGIQIVDPDHINSLAAILDAPEGKEHLVALAVSAFGSTGMLGGTALADLAKSADFQDS
jgi:hypothetical protein